MGFPQAIERQMREYPEHLLRHCHGSGDTCRRAKERRVPWHDRAWDGHVRNAPLTNSACLALKLVAEKRRDDLESTIAGEAFDSLAPDEIPPCLRASASFLSPHAHSYQSVMSYSSWSKDHAHIEPRSVHVPAWGVLAVPYRWMLKESGFKIA
jgi:hypothetical protein